MADKRITELPAIDALVATDLIVVVDDPAGTPVTKRATISQLPAGSALQLQPGRLAGRGALNAPGPPEQIEVGTSGLLIVDKTLDVNSTVARRNVDNGFLADQTIAKPGPRLLLRDTDQLPSLRVFELRALTQVLSVVATDESAGGATLATPLKCYRNGDVGVGAKLLATGRLYEQGSTTAYLGQQRTSTPSVFSDVGASVPGTVALQYTTIGQTLWWSLQASSLTISTATPYLRVTLPIASTTSGIHQSLARGADAVRGWVPAATVVAGAELHLYQNDFVSWAAGTAHIMGQGFYFI